MTKHKPLSSFPRRDTRKTICRVAALGTVREVVDTRSSGPGAEPHAYRCRDGVEFFKEGGAWLMRYHGHLYGVVTLQVNV